MGNPAQNPEEALCGCPTLSTTCPCCGLADAVAEEYDICPRCSWEHCSGDEIKPWLGSAFSGPNHKDLGHYRLDLWRWLLTPQGEPPRMSLIALDQDGRDDLEKALLEAIQAQGVRPLVPSVNLTDEEVLGLDKSFGVSEDEDETHTAYWSMGSGPEKGSDILYDLAECRLQVQKRRWGHVPFTELMELVASDWAWSRVGSFEIRWQRVLICASLAHAGVIGPGAAKDGAKTLHVDVEEWLNALEFVENETLYQERLMLLIGLEQAVKDDPQGFFHTALHGL